VIPHVNLMAFRRNMKPVKYVVWQDSALGREEALGGREEEEEAAEAAEAAEEAEEAEREEAEAERALAARAQGIQAQLQGREEQAGRGIGLDMPGGPSPGYGFEGEEEAAVTRGRGARGVVELEALSLKQARARSPERTTIAHCQ
jgi:hypothetical protein